MTNPKEIHEYMYKVTCQFIHNTKSFVQLITFCSSCHNVAFTNYSCFGCSSLSNLRPILWLIKAHKPLQTAELKNDFSDVFLSTFWDFDRGKIEYNSSFRFLCENEPRNGTTEALR